MKKIACLLTLCLLLCCCFLVACNEETPPAGGNTPSDGTPAEPTENLQKITGVTLSEKTCTYDGGEKTMAVTGTLPEGVSATYENEKGTDAGVYHTKVTLSGKGYETLVLHADLTINKAVIEGISAEAEQSLKEDGSLHLPQFSGTLPQGVQVKYLFDGQEFAQGIKEVGTYAVKLVFSGKNYEELTIPLTFKIKLNLKDLANAVLDSFGAVPNAWDFLPEKFASQYHTAEGEPLYETFAPVSGIPYNGLGKQMNVVYGLLNKTDTALSYINKVYASLNVIKTLYSNYLDGSPDNYKEFSGNAGGFSFAIQVTDNTYYLRAAVGKVNIELFSMLDDSYGARVQLTDTTVLKYTVAGGNLKIALNILNTSATQMTFERDEEGNTVGTVYEYLTVAGKELKAASAMLFVIDRYTVVIGTKGDFIPKSEGRNCEIYDNTTGRFVGSEVREVLEDIPYNTYWFTLDKIAGIESIKKEDKANGINADTIYINGVADDTIHTKVVGGFPPSKKTLSRRFDIEFKTMYFWVYNAEKEEYESVKYEVPMMFIQEEVYAEFEADFAAANKKGLNNGQVIMKATAEDLAAISAAYETLLPTYDALKDAVTQQMIEAYCGITPQTV